MTDNTLRKDFLIERYSLIAEGRGKRPHDFKEAPQEKERCEIDEKCFFCKGNEHMTPPEIFRKGGEQWTIRGFDNKFAAVSPPEGKHEIIVDSACHDMNLEDHETGHIREVFLAYEERRKELDRQFNYTLVFRNRGDAAGASLKHSHTQLIALNMTPTIIAEENENARRYKEENGRCAFCDLIGKEDSKVATKDDKVVALCPNAPRFPYEFWLFPKRHVGCFSELDEEEQYAFVDTLKRLANKLVGGFPDVSFNFSLHTAPKKSSDWYHFHLEFMPRMSKFAGFELGGGVYICTTSPENAASFYR